MFQSNSLSKDPKIVNMIQLAWEYRDLPIEEYLKKFKYWFEEYDKEMGRWEDDGGSIL
jgi:hypothetical protein